MERLHGSRFIILERGIPQLAQLLDKLVIVYLNLLADKDKFIAGLLQAFLVHQKLFLELFAGPESRKLDFYILVGNLAIHADKVFGQGHDFHGLAHVEHEYLATMRNTCRLEHKVHRLGYRHKVADNVGVRHGNGLALLYLAFEQRNDAPVAPEHVAKAGTNELGAAHLMLGQILHNHFAAALARPHHVGRVHRLVGTDHHELLDPVEQREERHVEGSRYVVLNGLHGAVFHEGHMLVRRRVEHHVGLVPLENLVHAVVVAHASDKHRQVQRVAILHEEFLLDFVGVVLVNIYNHDLLGAVLCNLAHEFAADAAAATRNHADLALDKPAHIIVVKGHRFAPEQVFYLDVANLLHKTRTSVPDARGIEQVPDKRQNLHGEASLSTNVENGLTVLGRATGNGEHNLLDMFRLRNLEDIARTTRDKHATDGRTNLIAVVIDQAYRLDCRGFTAQAIGHLKASQFRNKELARLARADNHGALSLGILAANFRNREECIAEHEPEKAYTDNRNQARERRKTQVRNPGNDVVEANGDGIAEHHADNAAHVIFPRKIAPQFIVRAGQEQRGKAAHDTRRKEREKLGASNAVGINGYRKIRDKSRNNHNKSIRKRKQTFAEPEVRKKFLDFFHFYYLERFKECYKISFF